LAAKGPGLTPKISYLPFVAIVSVVLCCVGGEGERVRISLPTSTPASSITSRRTASSGVSVESLLRRFESNREGMSEMRVSYTKPARVDHMPAGHIFCLPRRQRLPSGLTTNMITAYIEGK